MIKLKEPGERGGTLLVEMTPFDLISLKAGIESAVIHLSERKEENPESWKIFGLEGLLKDQEANLQELVRVQADREGRMKE